MTTTETMLRALVAAGNQHLATPNVKTFAFALHEAETYLAGAYDQNQKLGAAMHTAHALGLSPIPQPATRAPRPYIAPDSAPWPPKWPNPDAILAACVEGAREGQVRTALGGIGQFAARHAMRRLEGEGWIRATKSTEKATSVWWCTEFAISGAAPAPEPVTYSETTVETVRSLLPRLSASDANDVEDWTAEAKHAGMDLAEFARILADPAEFAEVLAGVVVIPGEPPRYWLPPEEPTEAEPEPVAVAHESSEEPPPTE